MIPINVRKANAAGIKRHMDRENRRFSAAMVEIPREQWTIPDCDTLMRVFRSNRFIVQQHSVPEDAHIIRLTVNRTMIGDDGHWLDGITWEELQQVKSGCGYGEHDAVEVYPRDSDAVTDFRMRHLFVYLGEGPSFIWRP